VDIPKVRYSEGLIFRRLRFPNPNLEYEAFGISSSYHLSVCLSLHLYLMACLSVCLSGYGSIFRRFDIPKVRYSEGRYSEGLIFRRLWFPNPNLNPNLEYETFGISSSYRLSVCLSLHLSGMACLSVCLSVCLSLHLSVMTCVCLSVCLSLMTCVCLSVCVCVQTVLTSDLDFVVFVKEVKSTLSL